MSPLERIGREERGGVLVLVTVMFPVLLLFASFVIDVGNWYEHRRHLQVQADAGALAGGGLFYKCIAAPDAANPEIRAETRRYAGDDTLFGSYNRQVGEVGRHRNAIRYGDELRINAKTFFDGGPGPDDTVEAEPCTAKMIDVKLTDDDVPWFFRVARVDAINARARVSIKAVDVQAGMLPFAVPELRPNFMFATFVDEATGLPLSGCANQCTVELTNNAAASPSGGLEIWDNSGSPFSVPVNVARVGVRIRVVEGLDPNAACGSGNLVGCYLEGTDNGVVMIRGWNDADATCASGSSCVAARDVRLLPDAGCTPDAYFTLRECQIAISAEIAPTDHSINGLDVTARVPAANRNFDLDPPTAGNTWVLARADMPVNVGPNDVTLSWTWSQTSGTWRGLTCENGRRNPCVDSGTFGQVQRTFVANPVPDSSTSTQASGPLKLVQVGESGVSLTGASSFRRGTTHDLVVRVGVTTLENASSYSDPTVLLRLASPSGSRNQALDCDLQRTLRDEITAGCRTPYRINASRVCPLTSSPAQCVPLETGDKVGQVKQGMDERFAPGGICSANNWQPPPGDPTGLPVIGPGDPRVVPLIITTWNAFAGSGSGEVPVVMFTTFYVTGWNGNVDCTAVNESPPPGTRNNSADVWGHFIKYIDTINNGSTGSQLCAFDAFGNCVVVLTK